VQDPRCASPTHPPALEKQLKTFREKTMTNLILKSLSRLHKDEAGQGLVEYALILALIAFAAVVAMQTLATDINSAFTNIGDKLTTYIT
jgi:pilus assembly protein Flp/PilA